VTPSDVLELLEASGALLTGHFKLSSGLHSDRFIQKFRIFEDPPRAEAVAAALARRLAPANPNVVVSAAVGGIIPGFLVAKALGVRSVFVEKETGKPTLRRGFRLGPADRAAVVEDVMTTGASTREAIGVVEAHGAAIVAVGAVVRRGKADVGRPVESLLDLPLEDSQPENCRLCQAGLPLDDPGSRRANAELDA